ncbi:MAG: glycerate kinase [Kiritimatiellae bacterium]|jgi:glycerate kinase|nr:glycerate kinase [Kiritimatiellia bacterium]
MRIVTAFDSFKGCLSSQEIIAICKSAITEIDSSIQVRSLLIADGGEGTLHAVIQGASGDVISDSFTNLEGAIQTSSVGFVDDLCVLESAQIVSLSYSDRQNLSLKTSRGIGEQIKFGLDRGYRKFAIGLGGSGTNDCGIGMLRELGFKFLDKKGDELPMDVKAFINLASIDDVSVDLRLRDCEFAILSDVASPLCGEHGATYVYGPQKGAKPYELPELDVAITQIADASKKHFGIDCSCNKGAGAAGGLGYAFLQFLGEKAVPGIEYVLKIINAEKIISECDFVFTGEGKSDAQTACGKVAVGVAALAKKHNKPVLLISGALSRDAYLLHDHGIDFITSIQDYPATLENVLQKDVASKLLSNRIKEIVRLINMVLSIE